MKRLLALFIVTITLVGYSRAQKFGKVDDNLVLQKVHPADSTADAAYIFKNAFVKFSYSTERFFMNTQHHQRIKIYNEDGERFGDFSIYQRIGGSDRDVISGLKAVAFNEVNGKIVKTELKKKDTYLEKTTDEYGYKKFAIPDVKPGTVIDVKYTISSPHFFTIPRFDFQTDIPVDKAEYEIRIPEYFSYTPIPTGFVELQRAYRDINGNFGNDAAYTFTATDVPAMQDDDYVMNTDDYRSSLTYELMSVDFPSEPIQYFSKSWNEVAKDIMASRYFGKEMRKKVKDLQPIVESISGMTEREKIATIYSFVQSEYNWNGYLGYQRHVGYKDLLKTKNGNIGDINQLLINLLSSAGVDVKPLLIKSRRRGLLNEHFPTTYEFDYVIAYVTLGDKYLLLDATDKFIAPGQLPNRAVNLQGLLIDGKQGQIIRIKNPNKYEIVTMAEYVVDLENSSLVGDGKVLYKKFAAAEYRADYDDQASGDEEDGEEAIDDESEEEEDDEYEIDNEYEVVSIENLKDKSKDIKLAYKEVIRRGVGRIGGQIFIDAALDFGIRDNPFYEEERMFPVFFKQLYNQNHIVRINIPEGYQVESMPSNIRMTAETRDATFSYEVGEMSNTLIIKYLFKIDNDVFMPGEYAALKKMYDLIVERSKEKIILTPTT